MQILVAGTSLKDQKMGLGPAKITLNFESDLNQVWIQRKIHFFHIYLLLRVSAEICTL